MRVRQNDKAYFVALLFKIEIIWIVLVGTVVSVFLLLVVGLNVWLIHLIVV